jgi:hypothetical protein
LAGERASKGFCIHTSRIDACSAITLFGEQFVAANDDNGLPVEVSFGQDGAQKLVTDERRAIASTFKPVLFFFQT